MKRRTNRLSDWLVRLFPVDVREAHGEEMRQVLGSANNERKPGTRAALAFWAAALADVLEAAPRQHAEALVQDLRYTARYLCRAPIFALSRSRRRVVAVARSSTRSSSGRCRSTTRRASP